MLLIDKPLGISSFKIVSIVRRITGVKKVGHAGTLDPLATGLMLILVGRDETKRASELLGLDKSYIATVRLGQKRSTGDLEGVILDSKDMSKVTRVTLQNGLKQALKDMHGTLQLPVPAYSAIKQDGQRLYKKARKGQELTPPIRNMYVYKASLLNLTHVTLDNNEVVYEAKIMFYVKSGVYVRSLAEELGDKLGYPATLSALRRISIGKYSIENAQILDNINDASELIAHKIDV